MLFLGQCPGIAETGDCATGSESSTYLMIEEMDLDVPPTDDVIPHPQETVFNTKMFYGDEVSGDDDAVYRYDSESNNCIAYTSVYKFYKFIDKYCSPRRQIEIVTW